MRKFLPYILISLFILVGLFSPMAKVKATGSDLGTCTVTATYEFDYLISYTFDLPGSPQITQNITSDACKQKETILGTTYSPSALFLILTSKFTLIPTTILQNISSTISPTTASNWTKTSSGNPGGGGGGTGGGATTYSISCTNSTGQSGNSSTTITVN